MDLLLRHRSHARIRKLTVCISSILVGRVRATTFQIGMALQCPAALELHNLTVHGAET